ncbi:MAG: TonB-dependent receptor [Myxococcales bacterium]|nr:TonB-dependent receptor [Myxococcales bacterium]
MKRRLSITTLILCLVAPSLAHAQASDEDTAELEGLLDESVVSSASKSAETTSTAPATSVSISAEELRRHGIRTVDEAINYLAMGMVTEKFFQTTDIGARGVTLSGDFGAHVLLMLDGHVLNEQWGAGSYYGRGTMVPIELVDHIEIVLGPGSVLYGSNAMLGVVHLVTKRAKDFKGAHFGVDTEIPTSIRGMAGVGHELQLFGADAEVTFAAEYFAQFGPSFDFRAFDPGPDSVTGLPRRYSKEKPLGIWGGKGDDAHYTRAPGGYLRFRVGNTEAAVRAAVYKRTYPTNGGNFDDPDSFEQDRWLNVDLKHTFTVSKTLRLSARAYGDLYDYRQDWTSDGAEDCLPGQDSGCLWRLTGISMSTGLEPQAHLDWAGNGSFVTLLGVDGRLKQVKSKVDFIDNLTGSNPGSIGVYDEGERALGAYVQQTAAPVDFLALNAGVRLDADDRFGNHLSPRAAGTVFPWKGGALKAIYSEAFRAPTAFEIYYRDPLTQIPGGDGLDPEVVRSVEASFEQRFGRQRILIGAFRSWWKDLAVAVELSPQELADAIARGELEPAAAYGYQVRNLGSIENYGLNALYEGSAVAGRLRYGLSFTEAFTRLEDPGSDPVLLEVAPSWFGNARISYDFAGGLPTAALATRIISRRQLTRSEPGFADPQIELRAALTGPVPGLTGLSYRLTANYTVVDDSPYVVGPPLPSGERLRAPVDRFRTGVGLQYDLGW